MATPKNKAAPKKPGRPTGYSKALADKICEAMADGETLTNIVKPDNMPTRKMVIRWLNRFPEFRLAYDAARIDQMHAWSDQIVSLADDDQSDWLRDAKGDPVMDANGQPIRVAESIARTKLRIETRRWLMTKILPSVFGDKLAIDAKHTVESTDDAELIFKLRETAKSAGLDADQLIAMLTGTTPATKAKPGKGISIQ